jgi:hypothetical protein
MWKHVSSQLEESLKNSFVSLSIRHWQCSKQTPVEGALLCWSFSLLLIFQPRSVSSPYFCVLMLTLVGNNHRWFNTTTPLLWFLIGRFTNRSLHKEFYSVEVWCYSCFPYQVYLFSLLLCFSNATAGKTFYRIWNYYISSCIPHLQSHKQIFVERALPYWSSTSTHVFRPGLTFLPITLFQCWNWWGKFSYHLKLLHPLLYFPPVEPQTDLCRESTATLKFKVYSCFLDQVWLFCLPLCFGALANERKLCSVWNYCIPSCIPH